MTLLLHLGSDTPAPPNAEIIVAIVNRAFDSRLSEKRFDQIEIDTVYRGAF